MQALKEAFEVFCNKGVSGSSSAELLATFCDNILKKGCSEKLSDEAIEDALEKVSWFFLLLLLNYVCQLYMWLVYSEKTHVAVTGFQVVRLLAYISDKDLFAEFYR